MTAATENATIMALKMHQVQFDRANRLLVERDRARAMAADMEQQNAHLRASLAELVEEFERREWMAAAALVGRMITKEQQHDGP